MVAQLRSEGAASRVLLVVPKPLLGQWQDELYRLFGIQAVEGNFEPGGFSGAEVFLVGREVAGSERGSEFLREAEPFDLCIIGVLTKKVTIATTRRKRESLTGCEAFCATLRYCS